jgi:hypothetical protein
VSFQLTISMGEPTRFVEVNGQMILFLWAGRPTQTTVQMRPARQHQTVGL